MEFSVFPASSLCDGVTRLLQLDSRFGEAVWPPDGKDPKDLRLSSYRVPKGSIGLRRRIERNGFLVSLGATDLEAFYKIGDLVFGWRRDSKCGPALMYVSSGTYYDYAGPTQSVEADPNF